jgi:hypothetical protein
MNKVLKHQSKEVIKSCSNYVSTEFMHQMPAIQKKITPLSILFFIAYGLGAFYFGQEIYKSNSQKKQITHTPRMERLIEKAVVAHYNRQYSKQDLIVLKEELRREFINKQQVEINQKLNELKPKVELPVKNKKPEVLTYSPENYNYLRAIQEMDIQNVRKKWQEKVESIALNHDPTELSTKIMLHDLDTTFKREILRMKAGHNKQRRMLLTKKIVTLK